MKQFSIAFSAFSFVGATIASSILVLTSPVLAQSAGCGSGWSNTALRYLSPVGSRQFRVACDEHDVCYDTLGKSRQECDKAFHNRMLGICARDHNTWIGKPLRIACNGRADAYYTGVLEGGKDKYNKAQAAARPSTRFTIVGLSNKCIGVRNGNSEGGTPLILWECNGNADQRWSLTSQGYLQGLADKCIGVQNGNSQGGTPLTLWECNGNADQKWSLTSQGYLQGLSGKCIGVQGGNSQGGTPLILWECNGNADQKWRISP